MVMLDLLLNVLIRTTDSWEEISLTKASIIYSISGAKLNGR